MWEDASTFEQLLKLNEECYETHQSNPYHADTVNTLLPCEMVCLNRLGLFTFASGEFKADSNGQWISKPFVSFLVPHTGHPLGLLQYLEKSQLTVFAAKVEPYILIRGVSKSGNHQVVIERRRVDEGWENSLILTPLREEDSNILFSLVTIQQVNPWVFDVVKEDEFDDIDLVHEIKLAIERNSATHDKQSREEDWAHLEVRWKNAQTFCELLNLNKEFLSGMSHVTPYHVGPIDPETIPLVPGLLKLHKLRIFTVSSQPFEQTDGDHNGEEYYDHWQKPFLELVMAGNDQPVKLFKKLREYPGLAVYAATLFPYEVIPGSTQGMTVVTKYRNSSTVKDLQNKDWFEYSTVHSYDPSDEDLFELKAMRKAEPWVISVAVTEWERDVDLIATVEHAAKECGIRPLE